jgi:hypothetical protein
VHNPGHGSRTAASISSAVQIVGHEELDPLPCYFNLQQVEVETHFLTPDLEAHPAPLPVMGRDGDHGKRPWGEGPSHDGRQSSSR